VSLFAVDNVGSITILMSSIKDKKNLLSSVRGIKGKNERSPELYYFLKGPLVKYNFKVNLITLSRMMITRGPKIKELP